MAFQIKFSGLLKGCILLLLLKTPSDARSDPVSTALEVGGPVIGAVVAGQIAKSMLRQFESASERLLGQANNQLAERLFQLDEIVDDAIRKSEEAARRVVEDVDDRAQRFSSDVFMKISSAMEKGRCILNSALQNIQEPAWFLSKTIDIESIVPLDGTWGRRHVIHEFANTPPFTRVYREIERQLISDLNSMKETDPAHYITDTYVLLTDYARRAACSDMTGDAISPSMRDAMHYGAMLNNWNSVLDPTDH